MTDDIRDFTVHLSKDLSKHLPLQRQIRLGTTSCKQLTVWYGMVWYGMVWYGMVGYGTVRYGTVRYGTVRYGTVRYGTVRYGTVRYGAVRYGTVWYIKVYKGIYLQILLLTRRTSAYIFHHALILQVSHNWEGREAKISAAKNENRLNCVHCKQDPIYVFPEMKLRGLVPNLFEFSVKRVCSVGEK
jgi:hypothetical protein